MKLLIIRPEPGASATAERVRAAGHEPLLLPFFEVTGRPWSASPPETFDALLLTSANAVRHAGPGLEPYRSLPAYAVGERTAAALRAMGIEPAATGSAGVQSALAKVEANHQKLLWLAGEDHSMLEMPRGMTVETAICYTSEPRPLPPTAAQIIAQADAVALHSARAAQHFSDSVQLLGCERAKIAIAAFSSAIAKAAGPGWALVATAAQPTDSALLSALDRIASLSVQPVERDGQ